MRRLLEPLGDRVRLNSPVDWVRRLTGGVEVDSAGCSETFDQVVLATHADQSLRLLSDSTADERQVLQQFPYQPNEAVLHTDTRLLPMRRKAWASWNYRLSPTPQASATVTYDLNRLQRLGLQRPLLLTLNGSEQIRPEQVICRIEYFHPAYSTRSTAAQQMHHRISGLRQRTHFCGAYWGYGFHEDGVSSALAVARQFGLGWESCTAVSTKAWSHTVASSH